MGADYLPRRDAELVTYVGTFSTLIVSTPAKYGLTAEQASHYADLAAAFIDAYAIASADATRSPSNIMRKSIARDAVVANTRLLAGIIQKLPGTTDAMRLELGLTVAARPAPIAPPAESPNLTVVSRIGPIVRIQLRGSAAERRGKPAGVQGARVYSYIGVTPPANIQEWKLEGQLTRTIFDIIFPPAIAPGTVVWLTAQWYNPRGQTGPACAPVSTYIAGGAMMSAA